jgi:hypothetical protein
MFILEQSTMIDTFDMFHTEVIKEIWLGEFH